MASEISTIDLTIVILYVSAIFAVGLYAFIVARKEKVKDKAEQYFLASRDTPWIPVAFTIFSSNIGAEHFIGLAGTAAKDGIAVGMFEWSAPFALFVMAYFVSEIYLSANIVTTPEYLEMRFNRKMRIYNALIMLFIFIFTVISATLYAGSIILDTVFGWNMWFSSIVLISITGIYVILGGLRAVIYTENVQAVVLLCGGILVAIMALNKVGGWSGIEDYYNGIGKNVYLHMARPANDPDWPWPGVYLVVPLQGYYYWTCNQMLVQRVLSAKSQLHSKYGAVLAATLKILPVFMMVIPGMISTVLYGEYFIDDDDTNDSDYDKAYPVLVTRLLPKGLIGFVIASMLSALMSSLASVYNSASTIITNDVYKLIFPNVNDERLVQIGRISSCVFILVSVLWIPIIANGGMELFPYIQQIYSYIQNPLAVMFFFGHFWKGANIYGAYACVIIGTGLGLFRFIFGFLLDNKFCHNAFCEMHYLYFGGLNFIICSTIMVVVSKLTPGPTPEQINGYVYGTTNEMMVDERSESLIDEDNEDRVEMIPTNNNNNNNSNNKRSKNNNDSSSVNDGKIDDDEFITTNLDKMTFEEVMTNMDNDGRNNGCCNRCMHLDGDKSRFKKIVNIWTCITTIILLGLYIGYA